MINFFNFKELNAQYLITNDLGRYAFISDAELLQLVNDDISPQSKCGKELEEKGFVFSSSRQSFLQHYEHQMRDSKNYLFGATSLHIVVVTAACNLRCVYCQAGDGENSLGGMMTQETAEKVIETILDSPNQHLTIEFQGGEPLLNYPIIQFIVEMVERKHTGKDISFSVVTNLTLLTNEMISFFAEHRVGLSTSIDGAASIHNANRPYPNGSATFDDVVRAVERLRKAGLDVGAIQTTTRMTLSDPLAVIDTYYNLGFNNIFLRPLSPLGCAGKRWDDIGYTAKEFVSFYRSCLAYIIKKNKKGFNLQENTAAVFLSKILHSYPVNYMELRSPCGAITGQMAYHYTGDVFTCDEGRMLYEMGDTSFRLGKVGRDCYNNLVDSQICSPVCKASVLESIPSCCDCAYLPYCGACPAINFALYRDIIAKEPRHYRCIIYSGILDELFSLIQEGDPSTMEILKAWCV